MSLEDLIKTLEQKVPGFSYTVFSHQPGVPVFLQWNHREPGLQKREALMPRSIVAKDLKTGFEQVLARYEGFEREDALKKKEAKRPPVRPAPPPPEFIRESEGLKPRRTTTTDERDYEVPAPRRRALVLPE